MTAVRASVPSGFSGAVDEAEQVAFIKELEAVHLVEDACISRHPMHEPLGQIETQVKAMGADMEQHVAWGRDRGLPGPGYLNERVQTGRARIAEQTAG